jgi:hypothetical protein
MSALLPCPFCGGGATILSDRIACDCCLCAMARHKGESDEELSASWNRRAPVQAASERPTAADIDGLMVSTFNGMPREYLAKADVKALFYRAQSGAQGPTNAKDAARLDFVEANPHMFLRRHKKHWSFIGFTNYEYDVHKTVREAIDAAIERMTGNAGEGGA